jgi:hypothetical protein
MKLLIRSLFTFVWMCFFSIGIWTFSYKNWIIAREMPFYLYEQGYLTKESGCRISENTYKIINVAMFIYITITETAYLTLIFLLMYDFQTLFITLL